MNIWRKSLHGVKRVAHPVRTRVGDEAAGSRASVQDPVDGGQARDERTRRGPGRHFLALSSLAGAFLLLINRARRKGGAVPATTPERDKHDTRQATAALNSDDDARLSEILAAVGTPSQLGRLLSDYYRDKARADRTSRELLYLHLGIASGALRNATGAEG